MKYQFKLPANMLVISMAFFLCSSRAAIAQDTSKVDLQHLSFTVEEAPEWTNLFIRSSGWFGADGIYALPSDGARSKGARPSSKNMFIFSDTMVGDIKDGVLQPGYTMPHNSVAYLNGDEPKANDINFHWATDATGKPVSLFIPHTPSAGKQDYYWLGDGFVNTELHKTYIFAYRMRNLSSKDDWSFKEMETILIALPKGSKPPFTDQQQIETPLHYQNGKTDNSSGGYGAGIFVNTKKAGAPQPDGYVYVYGVRGKGNLVVSRVMPKDFEDFSAWRFWDGKTWNADKEQAAYLTGGVSNELSLSPLADGRYILVFELDGMGGDVAMRIGASPVGPFGPVIKLYNGKISNSHYFHYNAKAHPSLSAPGELLISYNQNSFDFWNQIKLNPILYHPYFLRLKFQ